MQLIVGGQIWQLYLVVSRGNILFIWEQPNLQELHRIRSAGIKLTVLNSRSGTHNLNLPGFNNGLISHAVFVLELPRKRDRNDFHVIVRVRAKAHARGNFIVVQHTQHTKVHFLRIVIIRKAETVEALEPTVVGGTS